MTQTIEKEIHADNAAAATKASEFVWYELHTPDSAAAAAFYGPVLGWKMRDAGVPNRKYTLVCVTLGSGEEIPVGGLLEKPAAAFREESPRWMGYIGVDDVGHFTQLVWQAGGAVHRAPEEIPGVGTFSVVGDPQGAAFTLFQPPVGVTRPEQPPLCTPGMPVWSELGAVDWEPEFRFYSGLLGWTKAHAIDMGPNGVYQIFAAGSQPIGGMMTLPNPVRTAGWLFYFQVEQIEAAIDRVKQNGGVVLHGPSPVPGGQFTAQCRDTQGAVFGMVGPGTK